jgi:hypothetical protein
MSEDSPVSAPTPPRRRRRPWIWALAAVAVAGLAAGLLVWAPWHQPPVAPAAVFATSRTATSVLVSWPASKGGGAPDHYLVLRDGRRVGSVPASRRSFTDVGLAPGSRHRYAVMAQAGAERSAATVKTAVVRTMTPSPVGLTVAAATWTSLELRWSPSPLGPVPDHYKIYNGDRSVGVVAGTADSYDVTGLAPGGTYQYQVTAVWGSAVSAPSVPVQAATLLPPVSGFLPVKVNTTSAPGAGATPTVGEHWNESWQFTPHCSATRCVLRLGIQFGASGHAQTPVTMTLRGSGRRYAGSARAQITTCSSSVKQTNTVTVSIAAKGAVTHGWWPAWTGTMRLNSPYTAFGGGYCLASSWRFSVASTG